MREGEARIFNRAAEGFAGKAKGSFFFDRIPAARFVFSTGYFRLFFEATG